MAAFLGGKNPDRVAFGEGNGTAVEAFSRDGRTLAVGGYVQDKGKLFPAVGLWEAATGKELLARRPPAKP
jgi:hypothetical protein